MCGKAAPARRRGNRRRWGSCSSSDDAPQLLVRQLVGRHDLGQLLRVPRLVLHEVGDADVLHVGQRFEALHVVVRHLRRNESQVSGLKLTPTFNSPPPMSG